jgi:hypothetical protein
MVSIQYPHGWRPWRWAPSRCTHCAPGSGDKAGGEGGSKQATLRILKGGGRELPAEIPMHPYESRAVCHPCSSAGSGVERLRAPHCASPALIGVGVVVAELLQGVRGGVSLRGVRDQGWVGTRGLAVSAHRLGCMLVQPNAPRPERSAYRLVVADGSADLFDLQRKRRARHQQVAVADASRTEPAAATRATLGNQAMGRDSRGV